MISSRRAFYPFRNGKKEKELGGVGGMERVSDPVVFVSSRGRPGTRVSKEGFPGVETVPLEALN